MASGLVGTFDATVANSFTIINSYNAGLFDKSASGEFR